MLAHQIREPPEVLFHPETPSMGNAETLVVVGAGRTMLVSEVVLVSVAADSPVGVSGVEGPELIKPLGHISLASRLTAASSHEINALDVHLFCALPSLVNPYNKTGSGDQGSQKNAIELQNGNSMTYWISPAEE